MDVLTALSAVHEPARAVALTAAREELSRKTATDASSQVLVRASIECLATLVSLAPRDGRVALFRETEAACKSKSFPPYDLPRLLARAAPGMGEVAPAVLLEAIALSHEYYRALGYALVAAELPPAWRARAIASALENAADPSLGDARVFVAIAPHLSPEMHPRAVELASRLHPSPGFGATAMRALQGNAEDVARDAAGGRSDQGLLALPRAALYARFLTVFEQGFAEDGDEPFEDERGCGLVEWMQLVPLLGGDDAARDVADAVAP